MAQKIVDKSQLDPDLLANLDEDLSPQLGADLDVNNFSIISADATGGAISNTIKIRQGVPGPTSGSVTSLSLYGSDSSASTAPGGSIKLEGGDGGTQSGGGITLVAGDGTAGLGSIVIRGKIGGSTAPELQFWEANANGNYHVSLRAPDDVTITDRIWILPQDDPTVIANQPLTSDTSGVLSFSGPKIFTGTGSPEGIVDAPVGSLYTDSSGGPGTTLYVKESATLGSPADTATGWIAK